MSNNDYILYLLNIEDKNIFILNSIKEKVIKNKNHKIIEGILTYIPEYCPCCGCINNSNNDIIKWVLEKIIKSKYLRYLIIIPYLFFINKDSFVNIARTLLLLKLIL